MQITVTRTFIVEATSQLCGEVMVTKELKAHGIVERTEEDWGYEPVENCKHEQELEYTNSRVV